MNSVQNSNTHAQSVVVTMTECSESVQVVEQNNDEGFMIFGTSSSDSFIEEGLVGAGLLGSAALMSSADEALLSELSNAALEEMSFSESNSFAQSDQSSYSEAQAEEEEDEASAAFFGTEVMEGDSLLPLLGIGAGAGLLSGIGGGGGSSDSSSQASPAMDEVIVEDEEEVIEPTPVQEQPSEDFQQVEPIVPNPPVEENVEEAPEEVVEAEVESSPQEDGLTGTPLDAYKDSLQQPEAESNQSQIATPSNEFEFDTADGSAPISSEAGNDFFAMDPVSMF